MMSRFETQLGIGFETGHARIAFFYGSGGLPATSWLLQWEHPRITELYPLG